MTNKQLFKALSNQQNRIIGLAGHSFHLTYYGNLECRSHFTVFVHGPDHSIIFNDTYDIEDIDVFNKIKELKYLIDDLLNDQKTRN